MVQSNRNMTKQIRGKSQITDKAVSDKYEPGFNTQQEKRITEEIGFVLLDGVPYEARVPYFLNYSWVQRSDVSIHFSKVLL